MESKPKMVAQQFEAGLRFKNDEIWDDWCGFLQKSQSFTMGRRKSGPTSGPQNCHAKRQDSRRVSSGTAPDEASQAPMSCKVGKNQNSQRHSTEKKSGRSLEDRSKSTSFHSNWS